MKGKTEPKYPDTARILLRLKEKDQKDVLIDNNPEFRETEIRKNTAKLKEIIEKIGWPTISKVGFEASGIAWLLAQHSEYDVEFQKQCLKLMQEVPEGEVKKQSIAYLIDKIRLNTGYPQVYGTQIAPDGNVWTVEDPDGLEKRRKEVGLNTMAEYLAQNTKFAQSTDPKRKLS